MNPSVTSVGRVLGLVLLLALVSLCNARRRGRPGCNDLSCPKTYGQYGEICSGPDRGRCNCRGKCVCRPGWTGGACECSEETDNCMASSGMLCSGRGECVCNECRCEPGYTGSQCDCDNLSCPYSEYGICSGAQHGRCECGECVCFPNYSGDACDCTESTDYCTGSNGELCNGHGNCECNKCKCEDGYLGPTCEECPGCPGQCGQLKPCVECAAWGEGEMGGSGQCCRGLDIIIVDQLPDDEAYRKCQFQDGDGCLFTFAYNVMEGNEPVVVRRFKECRRPSDLTTPDPKPKPVVRKSTKIGKLQPSHGNLTANALWRSYLQSEIARNEVQVRKMALEVRLMKRKAKADKQARGKN